MTPARGSSLSLRFMDLTLVNVKHPHWLANFGKNRLHAIGVRIGDEDLPEATVADQRHEVAHPTVDDLVEDIVEEEDGGFAHRLGHQNELGEFERDQIRFFLALRTVPYQRVLP